MQSKKVISAACLLLAAVIWGFAFVAQDVTAESVEPFTLNAARSYIAAVALVPVAWLTRKLNHKKFFEKNSSDRKTLLKAGVICGFFLFVAVNFQQFGIALYPADAAASGRAGFLTALYIVFVPIFGLVLKKKPNLSVIAAVVLAVAGLYFLCLSGGFGSLYLGDLIVLICGAAFAVQILSVDRFISRVDGVKLSMLMFFVTAVLSTVMMFIFESPSLSAVLGAWLPILFLGVGSSGVGYTLQIIGQKYSSSPTVSSILMSMESVFAAVGGWLLMGERLSPRELFGCALMLCAIIIAQLPDSLFKRKKTAS